MRAAWLLCLLPMLAFVSLARIAAGDGTVADLLALSSTLITGIVPDVTGV